MKHNKEKNLKYKKLDNMKEKKKNVKVKEIIKECK